MRELARELRRGYDIVGGGQEVDDLSRGLDGGQLECGLTGLPGDFACVVALFIVGSALLAIDPDNELIEPVTNWLIKNRRGAYGLPSRMDLVPGRISAHSDGYGFVMPDDGESDLYLSPRAMRTVLHGDRVLASVVGVDARGRREGAVREILERAHSRVVGHFVEESFFLGFGGQLLGTERPPVEVFPGKVRLGEELLRGESHTH